MKVFCVQLVSGGELGATGLALLMDLSENARLLVERHLHLPRPLYFDYTHLVCRTALPGMCFYVAQNPVECI